MANENLFTGKAGNYAQARPGYAPEAVEEILRLLQEISGGGTVRAVADIGSGTGILSREFLARGIETFCVEPNDEMRAQAERALGGCPGFHSVAASAENTALAPHSVALVTAASAFHWFDAQAFREECRRILMPSGKVALLINAREYDAFTHRQHAVCEKYCVGFKSLAHGLEKTLRGADAFFSRYQMQRFDFPLVYTREKFIARSLSSSYAPQSGTPEHAAYAAALEELLAASGAVESIAVANSTVLIWGDV